MNDASLATAEHAIQIPGVRATRIGLVIDESLTPEAIATVFACLEHITGCSNWLWGDALAFGGRKWGNRFVESKYKQAGQTTGLAIPTLKWARQTAERIPMARRRQPPMTFTHHAEVAFAFNDPALQDEWLDRAVAEKWTAIQLRRAIRLAKQEIFEEPNPEAGKYGPCAALMELVAYLRGEDPGKWDDERRAAWKGDLKPVVDFYNSL